MAIALKLLRNTSTYTNRAEALQKLKSKLNDSTNQGEAMIATYTNGDSEKILLGIKGIGNGYEIFEGASFDEEGNLLLPTAVQEAIDKILATITSEIDRAKAAEDKIEASVGLAADGSFTAPAGNYINGAATVMDAVEKLDVQAKANADKIAGMSVDEVNQTVTIDSKGLQFIALTDDEIRSAWTSRVAPTVTIPN